MIWLIALFTVLSYGTAAKSVLSGEYKPSIYSRVVWFFLAFNNFASVYALRNSSGIKSMVTVALAGNITILLLSLKYSKRAFGPTEIISSLLLLTSLIVWLTTRAPFLNLTIGIIAHFIGGIPTVKQVIENPRQEHLGFWFWFAIASILAWFTADTSKLSGYLFPAYVTFYDGAMFLLCARRFLPKSN